MNAEACYVVNAPAVISETVNLQVLVMYLEAGAYYTLDGSIAPLWDALGRGADKKQRYALAQAHYTGSPDDMVRAVDDLLTQLEAEHLIVPTASDCPPEAALTDVTTKTPFQPPRVLKFNDML